MRVVSQNRKISVDFDRTTFIRTDETIFAKIDGRDVMFGNYKTKHKVQEVFEDLHKAYAPVYSISDNLTEQQIKEMFIPSANIEAKNVLNIGEQQMYVTTYDNYVYYMPVE